MTLEFWLQSGNRKHTIHSPEVSLVADAKVVGIVNSACPGSLLFSFGEEHPAPPLGNNLSGVPCGFGEAVDQTASYPWPRSGNINWVN